MGIHSSSTESHSLTVSSKSTASSKSVKFGSRP